MNKENRERILKAMRENTISYKGKPIKITADFSTESLKVGRAWSEAYQVPKDKNFSPRILYPAKLSFKINRGIKAFYDK
jgi:hypothetical protein